VRQIIDRDHSALREMTARSIAFSSFAHVAWPVMAAQLFERLLVIPVMFLFEPLLIKSRGRVARRNIPAVP
jgi:hypothetical protein